jgi:hypothetical protein
VELDSSVWNWAKEKLLYQKYASKPNTYEHTSKDRSAKKIEFSLLKAPTKSGRAWPKKKN